MINCSKSIVIRAKSHFILLHPCNNRAKAVQGGGFMTSCDRIERITEVRKEHGLSIQQLADMSRLSASTVYRVLSGKTEPAAFTIEAMENALGITDKPVAEPLFDPGSISPLAERYINTLETRIARLRAHYNMLIATKNRWLMLSFTLNIILIVFLFCWIVYDIRTPAIGWIHG